MVKFKEYNQNQMMLLPPNLEDKVPQEHIARFISQVVDQLDIKEIESQYTDGGCRAYHPRLLVKILLYGYSVGVRSSRKIQQKIQEDLVFMWLAGMQEPNFRTISDFRKERLLNIKDLFSQVLEMCFELGMVKCGKVSLDGTKIEANSSRNKVTYRKSLERRKSKYEDKIDAILQEADEIDRLEDEMYGDGDGYSLERPVTTEEIKEALDKINKQKKQANKKLKENIAKLEVVHDQLNTLNNRNSYGNTDQDATLMQMKEGYLGVGYNLQMVSENQVILDYDLYQRPNDVKLLEPQISNLQSRLKRTPEAVLADKGYGSQANYEYLEKEGIQAVIPHYMFEYDKREIKNGTYKPSKNRIYERYKQEMLSLLGSQKGKALLKRRSNDIEPVFGNIKYNMNFRKFLLRLLPKATIEVGLVSLAHNIQKLKKHLKMNKIQLKYT